MLFDIPYLANWTQIRKRRQEQVDKSNARGNSSPINFDYKIGDKVLIIQKGLNRKAEDKNKSPYIISALFQNGGCLCGKWQDWTINLTMSQVRSFMNLAYELILT